MDTCYGFLLFIAIEAIHRAFVVGAVSDSEHVACFMHHHMAGVEEELLLRVIHLLLIEVGVVSKEAEDACPLLVLGPTEDIVPAGSRVEVLERDSQHAICIRGDERNRL